MIRTCGRRLDATIFSAIIFCTLTCCSTLSAQADEDSKPEAKQPAKRDASGLTLHRRTTDDAKQLEPTAMLSDLRDVRLSLGQVKQQAVNLFLEATRTEVTLTESPMYTSPTSISELMMNKTPKFYQPPRKEWLVYYMNTLEPIVQLLTDDIYDVDTNERSVSKKIAEQINPLWMTWKQDLASIQKSLDQLQGLIDDSDSNLKIGHEAVSIFQKVDGLEKIRYKVYLLFRAYYLSQKAAPSGHD